MLGLVCSKVLKMLSMSVLLTTLCFKAIKSPLFLGMIKSCSSQAHSSDWLLNHPSFLFPSQRLVPDSGIRLLGMEAAGGRGIVRSSLFTALDCTRPSKVKPTLLSASHNPQGGDDLDCPVKSMWSYFSQSHVCVLVSVNVCACVSEKKRNGGTVWGTRGAPGVLVS